MQVRGWTRGQSKPPVSNTRDQACPVPGPGSSTKGAGPESPGPDPFSERAGLEPGQDRAKMGDPGPIREPATTREVYVCIYICPFFEKQHDDPESHRSRTCPKSSRQPSRQPSRRALGLTKWLTSTKSSRRPASSMCPEFKLGGRLHTVRALIHSPRGCWFLWFWVVPSGISARFPTLPAL